MNQAPNIPPTPEPGGHHGLQPSSRNTHDQAESQGKVQPSGCYESGYSGEGQAEPGPPYWDPVA